MSRFGRSASASRVHVVLVNRLLHHLVGTLRRARELRVPPLIIPDLLRNLALDLVEPVPQVLFRELLLWLRVHGTTPLRWLLGSRRWSGRFARPMYRLPCGNPSTASQYTLLRTLRSTAVNNILATAGRAHHGWGKAVYVPQHLAQHALTDVEFGRPGAQRHSARRTGEGCAAPLAGPLPQAACESRKERAPVPERKGEVLP